MTTIGERIKQVRKDNDLTQGALAESIGIKPNSLAMLEAGKRNPSDITIRALCKKLHVNEEWLRTGAGNIYAEKFSSLADLLEQADLGEEDVALIGAYVRMPEEKRRFFRQCIADLGRVD